MQITTTDRLDSVPAEAWNALVGPDSNPFLSHAFLAGLERHGCLGERWGWLPRHILIHEEGLLVAALPLYLKFNSYGELVFDWNWADAYRRSGREYYPKMVSTTPYTPVTAPRRLIHPEADQEMLEVALHAALLELARQFEVSSVHLLFPPETELTRMQAQHQEALPLLTRCDVQFHWHNQGFADFDDHLARFNASGRKKVKRERRRVQEAGITVEVLHGHELDAAAWDDWQRFYESTFDKRGGYATLSRAFFAELGAQLGERVVVIFARYEGQRVAGALLLKSDDTLYGRHWGCDEEFHSLHFELCYYQGIEYAIAKGLKHFEPGAQGEHKVWRGFEPTLTWSAHWLADADFSAAIAAHLVNERRHMQRYREEMVGHLPFRQAE